MGSPARSPTKCWIKIRAVSISTTLQQVRTQVYRDASGLNNGWGATDASRSFQSRADA